MISNIRDAFGRSLCEMLPKQVRTALVVRNELIIYVVPKYLNEVLTFLKNHTNTQLKALVDLTVIDFPAQVERFEVVYILLSVKYNFRIRVKTCVDQGTFLDSCATIYSSAGWLEREAWDMFGVFFSKNPDLRRILTDYGFEGHPLRKDFPLSGFVEVNYDESVKRVVTKPLELTQEFRAFDFSSPWQK